MLVPLLLQLKYFQRCSLVYQTEKSLKEHESKIDASLKSETETEIAFVKEVLAKDETTAEEIKSAIERLQEKAMKIGEAIYKQGGETEGGNGGSSENGSPDDMKDVGGDK